MKTLAWIRLLFSRTPDPATMYDLAGGRLNPVQAEILVNNVGYWKQVSNKTTESIVEATKALWNLVFESAEISSKDDVLDLGCGPGEGTAHCLQEYAPANVTGVDISQSCVEAANKRIAKFGTADRAHIVQAAAKNIPLADQSMDKAVCVEAAFHFVDRPEAFREVHRVLRDEGIFSLVDFVPLPPKTPWQRLCTWAVLRSLHIPKENVCELEAYRNEVEEAGFSVAEFERITDDTVQPYRQWGTKHPGAWFGHSIFFWGPSAFFLFFPVEYVRVKAIKNNSKNRTAESHLN